MTTTTAPGTYFGRIDELERLLGLTPPASRRPLVATVRRQARRLADAIRHGRMARQWMEAIEQPKPDRPA